VGVRLEVIALKPPSAVTWNETDRKAFRKGIEKRPGLMSRDFGARG
jgi:hypothetical protein